MHSTRERCVCRVHSTSSAFVKCTRHAVRLLSALDKQCICQVFSTSSAFVECTRQLVCVRQVRSTKIFWRTPDGADRHVSVECYVFKGASCVECSDKDSNMCSRSTSKNFALGVVPQKCIGAVGVNIGSHQKCKISLLGVVVTFHMGVGLVEAQTCHRRRTLRTRKHTSVGRHEMIRQWVSCWIS